MTFHRYRNNSVNCM